MKKHFVSTLSMYAFLVSFHVSTAAYADTLPELFTQSVVAAEKSHSPRFESARFARTELYFGTARPENLPPVSEAEFQNFLDTKITPAFPDGLTLLKGLGQFRSANGVAIEEDSFTEQDQADIVAYMKLLE